MILFSAILALRYAGIYISISDHSYVAFYIETSVDQSFSFITTLNIPNIDLYNCHARFGGDLDYSGSQDQLNIVKDVILLQDIFYNL